MTLRGILLGVILGSSMLHWPPAAASEPVALVDIHPQQGKLSEVLRREAGAAARSGKVVFVEVGATWCAPCRALEKYLSDPLMQDAFAGTYLIRLDLDEWGDELKPLGLDGNAVPAFFAIDSTGHVTGARIDGSAWGEDIPANMAPVLKDFFRKNRATARE